MSGNGARLVFVVDDDEGVRASTQALLEASGFSVRTFADAEQLLTAGTAKDAGCIILDQDLSGITGLEMLEALRSQGVRTPAIMVTSAATRLPAPRATDAGIAIVLRKPLAGEALEDWLNRVLPEPV